MRPAALGLHGAALAAALLIAAGCAGGGGLVAEIETPLADVAITRTAPNDSAAGETAEESGADDARSGSPGSASEQLVLTPNYGVIVQAGGNVHVYPLPASGDVLVAPPSGADALATELEKDSDRTAETTNPGRAALTPGATAPEPAEPPEPVEPMGPPEPVEPMGPPASEPAARTAPLDPPAPLPSWQLLPPENTFNPLLAEEAVADIEREHAIPEEEMAEIDAHADMVEACRNAVRQGWTTNPWCTALEEGGGTL